MLTLFLEFLSYITHNLSEYVTTVDHGVALSGVSALLTTPFIFLTARRSISGSRIVLRELRDELVTQGRNALEKLLRAV